MTEEPTIEQLQKQLNEQRLATEQQAAELEKLKQENEKNAKALKDARQLNVELLEQATVKMPTDNTDSGVEEDSLDKICDDVVNKVNEDYRKRMKFGTSRT